MNITIIGRKCTPRESFKERAELKLSKVEEYVEPDGNAKETATVEKNIKIVEITLTKGGYIFRAQERSQDLEDALDTCVESLIRQIRKNKTKLEKKIHETSFDEVFNNADEAVLQMNMLGHQFYMFRNSESDDINVVYKRKDGGYGLLEPTEEWA